MILGSGPDTIPLDFRAELVAILGAGHVRDEAGFGHGAALLVLPGSTLDRKSVV